MFLIRVYDVYVHMLIYIVLIYMLIYVSGIYIYIYSLGILCHSMKILNVSIDLTI